MSGLGGLNPLPLRLGGNSPTTSWTAEDHAAVCRDLVLASRSIPYAQMILSADNDGTIVHYRGINGSGVDFAPTVTYAAGEFDVVFPLTWTDDFGDIHYTSIRDAVATSAHPAQGNPLTVMGFSGGLVQVTISGIAPTGLTQLVVWGHEIDLFDIDRYDGSTDKENTSTEVVPYAYSFQKSLQDARGSAYSKERGTLVYLENIVLARGHAGTWRRHERLASNANPATALEKAVEWQQVLGVRRRDSDDDASLRTRNAAKIRAALGPTRRTVDDSVAELLGSMYVRTWRNYDIETMVDDPTGTFWPSVNPGDSDNDLGGGAWYSDRQHTVIEVVHPPTMGTTEFDAKITDLTELLDVLLPATTTFDWVIGAEDGFILDFDSLDEGSLSDP